MFSQVPFKGKVGRRASPGMEKTHPGAKYRGVKDFTPTAAPTLPKKLIHSISGVFGRGGGALSLKPQCHSPRWLGPPSLPDTVG